LIKISKLAILFSILTLLIYACVSGCGCRQTSRDKTSSDKNSKTSGDIEVSKILPTELVSTEDIQYKGAFKLPEGSNGSSWEYSGEAMTYYPDGDPNGPDDGYPGSIFAIGHDHQQFVSEITIPKPVISSKKYIKELNTASTLQPFNDITDGMFEELEIPVAGLEYLPPQGDQKSGRLYFAWGQHFHDKLSPTHGWCSLDLSSPNPAGLWYFDDYSNYTTCDYIFEIPEEWANAYTPDLRLAAGRFREGLWSGGGPTLYAYGPWNEGNPPPSKAKLKKVVPLLLYGVNCKGSQEIEASDKRKMKTFEEADCWSGGAWLTAGEKSAVIFVGTKAVGESWYGFANGVRYPIDEGSGEDIPEVPPWPYDRRGWWSEKIKAQIIFYNPNDLAKVAKGEMKSWEPQPYASLDIDKYMFKPGFNQENGKDETVGAMSFDRERGILYIFELRADRDKSIIHVFEINGD